MSEFQLTVSILLVAGGIFFMFVGSLGLIVLPDFYSRTHAVSKSDNLGLLMLILGLVVFEGFTGTSLKLSLIMLFIALSNPIGTHAISRVAYMTGTKPDLTNRASAPEVPEKFTSRGEEETP